MAEQQFTYTTNKIIPIDFAGDQDVYLCLEESFREYIPNGTGLLKATAQFVKARSSGSNEVGSFGYSNYSSRYYQYNIKYDDANLLVDSITGLPPEIDQSNITEVQPFACSTGRLLDAVDEVSSAGIEWRDISAGTLPDLRYRDVIYVEEKGLFVAVANDVNTAGGLEIVRSTDGVNWQGAAVPDVGYLWRGIAYGQGRFVVVHTSTGSNFLVSTDAENWYEVPIPANNNWRKIIYAGGQFVTIGYGGVGQRIMTSPNGLDWTLQTTPADYAWRDIAYGNGLYVVTGSDPGGSNDNIMTSPDGVTWTLRTGVKDVEWGAVTYGNGLFVAVNNDNSTTDIERVMTSPDGINWTLRDTPVTNRLRAIAYGDGLFVAISQSNPPVPSYAIYSRDGVNWDSVPVPGDYSWEAIAYGNGVFVALNYDETPTKTVVISGRQTEEDIPFSIGTTLRLTPTSEEPPEAIQGTIVYFLGHASLADGIYINNGAAWVSWITL